MDQELLSFHIDAFTPDNLPMDRLAEYLSCLADLYGSKDKVHFQTVSKGSAVLQVNIEQDAYPKVVQRVSSLKTNSDVRDAYKAFNAIDEMLRADNATGFIASKNKSNIIEFPGRTKKLEPIVHITQVLEIDGVVIKIGGKDDSIPVLIKSPDGELYHCQINGQERAKELSKHYLGEILRLSGDAKLERHPIEGWTVKTLNIKHFEPIADVSLTESFHALRNIDSIGWKDDDDPIKTWHLIRGDD